MKHFKIDGGRPPTIAPESNNFDLIRLFAAMQVALKHILIHLEVEPRWIELLGLFPGVPIFFFISGFLIYQSYLSIDDGVKFFTNRFLRIYPALLGCFVVSVSLVIITGYMAFGELFSLSFLGWTAAQLSFFQIYNPDFLRGFGVGSLNGSLWTIAVELQFYLLTPVLFFLVRKDERTWLALLVIFIGLNVVMNYLPQGNFFLKLFSVSFPPWFYMFIGGAWLSVRPSWQQRIRTTDIRILFGVYGLTWMIGGMLGVPVIGNEINPVSYLLLALLVFRLAYTQSGVSDKLLNRNDISYGVYIYHMPIVNFLIFYKLIGKIEYVAIALFFTLLMASLSWKILERPALKLKRRALRHI